MMVFSATFACARCKLRFSRRPQCPTCGTREIFALLTPDGRARYRVAARTAGGVGRGAVLRLAAWAPRRPLVAIGGGILAMTPAVFSGGGAFPALAAAGAVFTVSAMLATLGGALASGAPVARDPTRVFRPSAAAADAADAAEDTTVTGVARRASVEITGPMSDEPCLVFGICGEVGDADVADADGGDFDVELSSGERVMISLEHAILEVTAAGRSGPAAGPREVGAALAELLESRAVDAAPADRLAVLEEHLVRDGDEVTVIGRTLGGTVTALGGRGPSRARVFSGDEDRPLIVRPLGRASMSQ